MPGQHKHNPLRFRPPEAEREWLEKRAEATGEPMNAILTASVRALIASTDNDDSAEADDPGSEKGR